MLCPDPEGVFHKAFDVLKVGGEMYFTEMYSKTPPPKEFFNDSVLLCKKKQRWDYVDTDEGMD